MRARILVAFVAAGLAAGAPSQPVGQAEEEPQYAFFGSIIRDAIERKVAQKILEGDNPAPRRQAQPDAEAPAAGPAVEKDERGGSFSVAPAILLPSGKLEPYVEAGPIYTMDFDVGINSGWSILFGGGYSDLQGKVSVDQRLLIAPAWIGFKQKAQFRPSVEVFWDLAGALYYEKTYLVRSGSGSIENLDGGGFFGAGFDLWLTSWLLAGVESRFHFIFEPGQVFPAAQLGLRLGIRG